VAERSRLRRVLRHVGVGVLAFVGVVALAYGVLRLVGYDFVVYSPDQLDMLPSYGPGAIVVIDRRAKPRRGDVIAIERPAGGRILTRVVALPGEHVSFIDSRPFVDGVTTKWDLVGEMWLNKRQVLVNRETLGDARFLVLDDVNRRMQALFSRQVQGYWVLEDNREHILGKDSRSLGEIQPAQIIGVVRRTVYAGTLPYWGAPAPEPTPE
jgi:signal peptidase I